jgi:hypothetical protein
MSDLETRGIPAVYVATMEFMDGAEGQAKAIGAKLAGVFVRHPIQDRTDDEMAAVAEDAFPGVMRGLVANA